MKSLPKDQAHKGHRQRMREKFEEHGARVFDTYELLEMLLYRTVPMRDVNPTAKLLLLRFGSLDGVFEASHGELTDTVGIGEQSAELILALADFLAYTDGGEYQQRLSALLRFVCPEPQETAAKICAVAKNRELLFETDADEITRITDSRPVSSLITLSAALASRRVCDRFRFGKRYRLAQLFDYVRALYVGASVETVYLLSFDEKGRFTACDLIGEGTANHSELIPKKLLEKARRRTASSVILTHNHPKAIPTPSSDDLASTEIIKDFLAKEGVSLAAHIIAGRGELDNA